MGKPYFERKGVVFVTPCSYREIDQIALFSFCPIAARKLQEGDELCIIRQRFFAFCKMPDSKQKIQLKDQLGVHTQPTRPELCVI